MVVTTLSKTDRKLTLGGKTLQAVLKMAIYGLAERGSGHQRQATGLLPLSKRAAAKSCFGQE